YLGTLRGSAAVQGSTPVSGVGERVSRSRTSYIVFASRQNLAPSRACSPARVSVSPEVRSTSLPVPSSSRRECRLGGCSLLPRRSPCPIEERNPAFHAVRTAWSRLTWWCQRLPLESRC